MATAEILLEQEPVARAWVLPRHIAELDGLRAIAILLVLVHHQVFWMAPSTLRSIIERGVVGVDLFFVLSGFLITGILLDSKGQDHAARNFYVRRGLRIWPLYFAFLAISLLLLRRMVPAQFAIWPYLLLIQNYFYCTSMGPALEPTWSLAVEEQFYFVWPWIVFRSRRETLIKICGTVLALSPMVRCAVRMAGVHPRFLYINTLCRLDPIAMGALIAAWVRKPDFQAGEFARFSRWTLPLGLAGWGLCTLSAAVPFGNEVRPSFLAMAFGGLTAAALLAQSSESALAKRLRSSCLRAVARISFALYLFNLPVYNVMHGNSISHALLRVPAPFSDVTVALLSNAVLFAAAALSWKFFESPILKLKNRLETR